MGRFLLVGWLLLAPVFSCFAQDGHSLKLGYLVSRGPTSYVGLGYEGTLAPRWSLAPMLGLSGSSNQVYDGSDFYQINGFATAVVVPVRFYPWYSQPEIKAGPFISSHIQYQFANASIDDFATASSSYLGWGVGAGWKAGIGRFSLEGFFNYAFLGTARGQILVFDPDPSLLEIVAFPYSNFTAGIMVGMKI
ncbi:MAG: hypothetical protein H6581_27920 [Bacteroidia bacterium]|nr:hypothetical protein [Bacteroidia bacterium]